jgi:serine/threonine protein kinase
MLSFIFKSKDNDMPDFLSGSSTNEEDKLRQEARNFYSQGNYLKAIVYYEELLIIKQKRIGEKDLSMAVLYNNLGAACKKQGIHSKAIEYCEKSLAIRLEKLGKKHIYVAMSYNHLGMVYDAQENYSKAIECYKKALAIQRKKLGKKHPDIAATYNNLGSVYKAQGNFSKAIECYKKALVIRQKNFGKKHSSVTRVYGNLKSAYKAQGDYLQAIKYHEKSLEITRKKSTQNQSLFDVGAFLGKYKINFQEIKILKYIATGAEATVFKVKWNDQIMAYKVFKVMDKNDIEGFEKEAQIMLGSNHPKIVRLYRICVKKGSFGLLMEFMELGSLKTVLKEKTIILNWRDKWNIAYSIALALEFLHDQEIVHRDIKTDNVLLCRDGNEIHAKIADFGLSKWQEVSDQSVTMGVGTFKYMAPEIMLGIEGYKTGHFLMKPTDIYALGMVCVALANNQEPYADRRNTIDVPVQVGTGKIWQEIKRTQCPPTFFKLVNKCRAIDLEERPEANKVIEELKEMKESVVNFKVV